MWASLVVSSLCLSLLSVSLVTSSMRFFTRWVSTMNTRGQTVNSTSPLWSLISWKVMFVFSPVEFCSDDAVSLLSENHMVVFQGSRETSICKKERLLIFLMTSLPSCTTEGKVSNKKHINKFLSLFVLQQWFNNWFYCVRGFFSANGLDTIVPVKYVENMGQRVKMTKLDIKRVRHLYKCGMCTLFLTFYN